VPTIPPIKAPSSAPIAPRRVPPTDCEPEEFRDFAEQGEYADHDQHRQAEHRAAGVRVPPPPRDERGRDDDQPIARQAQRGQKHRGGVEQTEHRGQDVGHTGPLGIRRTPGVVPVQ
jgi:hypothetical protein